MGDQQDAEREVRVQNDDLNWKSAVVKALLFVLCLAQLSACASVPIQQRESRQAEIDRVAEETIALLIERNPEFAEALEQSAGYFTSRVTSTTIAVVGGAGGIGVLVDKESDDRTYMNIKRLDLGAGFGRRVFRLVVLAEDAETLEKMRSGKYLSALAAEAATGSAGGTEGVVAGKYRAFVISDSGNALAATARLAKISVNSDLTDTGLSEVSIPNIGFGIEDGREPVEERVWNRSLPFKAQKVVDLGYDLPKPYGLKILYTDIGQDQNLDNLRVGFSGSEKEPFEFVAFENARSESETWQLVGDLWLLPFLNLFGYVGDLGGSAPMNVILDGNGMLDQLGVDCSRPGNPALCGLLQDREFDLPIDASFSGTNYGVGFNLAGGWKGFFFTLPVSWAWVDMDTTSVDGGAVLSVSPRAGRIVKLGSHGNLAPYLGAGYLDSDLTATGSLLIPDTEITIDYIVDQSNKDKWAGVLGANWDINAEFSLQLEYNGFWGSRESIIASLGWRF